MEDYMEISNLPEEDRKEIRKGLKDEVEKGYKEVHEEEIQNSLFSQRDLFPIDQVLGELVFEPVSLKDTPFDQFHLEGGGFLPRIIGEVGGETSSVVRAFTMPSGHRVEIIEADLFMLGIEGGRGPFIKELFNENLDGVPAMLSVIQDPNGNAISAISWETTTTVYRINMDGNVRENGQYEFLLEMARSILANAQ